VFIEAKDDGGGGDNWTNGAISRTKLQSNHTTNKPTSRSSPWDVQGTWFNLGWFRI